MKNASITLLVLVSIAAPDTMAQSPNLSQCAQAERTYQRMLLMADGGTEPEQQRRTAHQKEQQFWMKTEKFIASWTALAREYNEKGTFNLKKARAASKAFHDLEKTEGWPK